MTKQETVLGEADSKRGGLRIHQALAQDIGIAILSGTHKSGDRIEGEVEQSEALGVGRSAYREAIRILVAKGLLESRPRAGTHVTPRSQWNLLDPDVLAWTFLSGKPDEEFIRDLFELRGLIEPAAAALAASRRTDDHVARMRSALSVMRAKGLSTNEGREADRRFHSLILEAARNAPLASLASSVGAAVTWTTRLKQNNVGKPRDPIIEHLAVLEAIEAADPTLARQAMDELLRLALEEMNLTDLVQGNGVSARPSKPSKRRAQS